MADATIEILIQAVDEMSATLKKIEGNMEDFSKESKKQSESISQGFNRTTGNLIALGNAAGAVDNIFSSYQNQQIRVENASERLANAQDRLRDANYNLNKIMNNSESTAEDLAHAQDQVTSATRGLTIAQNNMQRVQGQVLGTMINIGVQTISLIGSIPQLVTAFLGLGPVGIVIGVVALALGGLYYTVQNNDGIAQQFSETWTRVKDSLMQVWIALQPLLPYLQLLGEFLALGIIAVLNGVVAVVEIVTIAFNGWKLLINDVIGGVQMLIDWIRQLIDWLGRISFGALERASGIIRGGINQPRGGGRRSVGDAIIRPDGSVIETDPRDTLIAARDLGGSLDGAGGGITVYIENVYGTNPTELSRALKRELMNKISI